MNIEFNQTLYLPVYLEYLTQYCQTLKIPLPLIKSCLYCTADTILSTMDRHTGSSDWLESSINMKIKCMYKKILENLNFF